MSDPWVQPHVEPTLEELVSAVAAREWAALTAEIRAAWKEAGLR